MNWHRKVLLLRHAKRYKQDEARVSLAVKRHWMLFADYLVKVIKILWQLWLLIRLLVKFQHTLYHLFSHPFVEWNLFVLSEGS